MSVWIYLFLFYSVGYNLFYYYLNKWLDVLCLASENLFKLASGFFCYTPIFLSLSLLSEQDVSGFYLIFLPQPWNQLFL